MPRVSIGMPVYTRTQFLEFAIRSLVSQTFQDWELLISDDASPYPEVREICERYSSSDRRVKYVRQPRNLGITDNHLYVLEHTSAPLFMWADEDDLWEPAFIERGVAALDADSTKSAWFCQVDRIDASGATCERYPPYTRFSSRGDKRREVVRFFMEPKRLGRHHIFYSLFRREALMISARLLKDFEYIDSADHIFAYSFICRNDIVIDPDTLFHKRVSGRGAKRRDFRTLGSRHFSGYYRAAAGTPFAFMTALLAAPRFVVDRTYKLRRAFGGGRQVVPSPKDVRSETRR